MYIKVLYFNNIKNIRDLGGLITKDNKITKDYIFVRSSVPYFCTDKEEKFLLDNNVKTIIDLRTKKELDKHPNFFKKDCFNYYNVDIVDGSFDFNVKIDDNIVTNNENELVNSYMCMLKNGKKINKILEICASTNDGILFNCSAGKDRTGVIAFLLLLIADCNIEDIVADYSLSYIYLKNDIDIKRKSNNNLSYHYGRSDPEYMYKLIDLFYKEYDDFNNYVKCNNLNMDNINKIRNKFLLEVEEKNK